MKPAVLDMCHVMDPDRFKYAEYPKAAPQHHSAPSAERQADRCATTRQRRMIGAARCVRARAQPCPAAGPAASGWGAPRPLRRCWFPSGSLLVHFCPIMRIAYSLDPMMPTLVLVTT